MNTNFKGFAHFLLVLLLAFIVVGGIGYYAYKNGQVKLISFQKQTVSPTPTSDETASQAPTGDLANWKTYRNEDGEFSFNYPHDAGLFENKIGATVIIPGDKPVGESMSNSFINLTFETVQKDLQSIEGIARLNYMQVNPETSEIISKLRNTEVNGHNGYMYKVRDKIVFGFDTTYTYLESPSKQNYVVIVSSLEDNDKLGYQKLHDQILSTFKFSD